MTLEKERLTENSFLPPWVIFEHRARFEFVATFCADKTVIDCACGPGVGTKKFSEARAHKILAFDLSEDAIQQAKKLNLKNTEFAVADAIKLPVTDKIADVYVSLETIEHLPKDQEFLKEVTRTLKLEGTFICSTPDREVTNPGSSFTDKPFNHFHLREYTSLEFHDLLKKFFSEIKLYGQNPQNILKIKLLTWIGRHISKSLAVKINQFLKLPGLIWKNQNKSQVISCQEGEYYEYLVAVCKK